MTELKDFVKKLLNTMVKGVGALFLLCFLPLFVAMCATAACLYFIAATIAYFLASLADEGNLSEFVCPRWSNRSKWIPQLNFD